MVLSNRAINRAMDTGRLVITPRPRFTLEGKHARFETGAVNLTLGDKLQVIEGGIRFDPSRDDIKVVVEGNSKEVILTDDEPFILRPGECVLAMTAEKVTLPARPRPVGFWQNLFTLGGLYGPRPLMGFIEGRSTLGRSFVTVHVTAPFIHNGTDHQITLEIANLGKWEVVLRRGMNIAQIGFVELSGLARIRYSQFHGQVNPSGVSTLVSTRV